MRARVTRQSDETERGTMVAPDSDLPEATEPPPVVGQTVGLQEHLPLRHLEGCPVEEDPDYQPDPDSEATIAELRVESHTDTDPKTGETVIVTRCQECGAHVARKE